MSSELREMLFGSDHRERHTKLAPDIEAIRLRDSLVAFTTKNQFKVGQIVRQKPQASLYKDFGDNDLAIVIAVLCEPIISSVTDSGSPFFKMPLDLVIGSIENEKDFCIYYIDSRRFEPVPELNLT